MLTEQEFWNMHHRKIYVPDHPYADSHGCVYEHRLEAEADLGRYLLPREQVHHHYLSKGGYLLAVCKNQVEHSEMHTREEAFRYSGHWDWRKCKYCKQYDDPNNSDLNITKSGAVYHKFCASEYLRKHREGNKTLQGAG